MRIPDHIIEEISRRVDIVEVIGEHTTLKRKGSRFMGLCPFHSEKTPSFSVNQELGAYYCFGCQRHGSVFTFVMETQGLSFPEAVRVLGERVGVAVEVVQDDEGSRRRDALKELYGRVAGTFVHILLETAEGAVGREQLSGRGLSDETIREFQLGFSPADAFWLHGFLTKRGYSEEFLTDCGLFTHGNPRRALFAGRLMFPIRDRHENVVAFGGRVVAGEGPKYINSPETALFQKRATLYGLDHAASEIRREGSAIVAEGYMDVLALHQSGLHSAVAPLGTALTADHARKISRLCNRAVLVFDADAAGIAATRRAAIELETAGVTPSACALDSGSDPADLLVSGGSQAVVNAVSSPLSILEFLVRRGMDQHDTSTPEGKQAILEELFPYLLSVRSEVRREESVRLASDLVGADAHAVLRDFARYRREGGNSLRASQETSRRSGQSQPRIRTEPSYDLFLMLATVRSREHFAYVRKWLGPDDLEDEAARQVYIALEESFRRDESSLEVLLGRIEPQETADMVRERLARGEFDGVVDQVIRDAVTAIRRRNMSAKIARVERELRRIGREGGQDEHEELDLLEEKMHLDQELQKLKGEER
jgi:DNA primase